MSKSPRMGHKLCIMQFTSEVSSYVSQCLSVMSNSLVVVFFLAV